FVAPPPVHASGIASQALPGPPAGVAPTEISPATVGGSPAPAAGDVQEPPAEEESNASTLRYLKSHAPAGVELGGEQIAYDGSAPSLAADKGTTFQGMTQNGWVPYDCAIAVGPSHVILMNNSQWTIL